MMTLSSASYSDLIGLIVIQQTCYVSMLQQHLINTSDSEVEVRLTKQLQNLAAIVGIATQLQSMDVIQLDRESVGRVLTTAHKQESNEP